MSDRKTKIEANAQSRSKSADGVRHNTDAAVEFLQARDPSGPWHICAIVPDGPLTARTFGPEREQDLRRFIDKPQSFVAKYENGERRLDVIELIALLRAMGQDSSKFIEELEGRMQSDR